MSRRTRVAAAGLVSVLLAAGRAAATTVDHAPWDDLVRAYVDEEGRVSYRTLAARDAATLDRYLATLAAVDAARLEPAAAEALWINAYNAGVVRAVLDGYAAETVIGRRLLFRWFGFDVGGARRTLHEIEHEILRPRFREPRVHFALVCASSSCPKLRRGAYTGATLEAALDEEARRFINDPGRNVLDPHQRTVRLSAIFRWFEEDFARTAGSVRQFVSLYVDSDEKRALLRDPAVTIDYLDYDWRLNAAPGQRP